MKQSWKRNRVFGKLSDAIASDRLIVFTGAGISHGLQRTDGSPMPGWNALLREVAKELRPRDYLLRDVKALFAEKPTGPEMIEAASILEAR